MPLQDLPPEIFAEIVHQVVNTVGVDQAWELRGLCRQFADWIKDDVVSKQPLSHFGKMTRTFGPWYGVIPSRVYYHIEAEILLNKTIRPLDANPELLRAINRAAGMISGAVTNLEQASTPNTAKRRIAALLCNALVVHPKLHATGMLIRGVRRRRPVSVAVRDLTNNMVAATAIGDLDALSHYVRAGAKVWAISEPFGYSLSMALLSEQGHQSSVVAFILQQIPQPISKTHEALGAIHDMFDEAIKGCLQSSPKVPLAAIFLIKWLNDHLPMPTKAKFNWWLSDAVSIQDRATIEAVIGMKRKSSSKVTWFHYQRALQYPGWIMEILVTKGRFNINKLYWHCCPLNEAIKHGPTLPRGDPQAKLNMVQKLLDLGADVNGLLSHRNNLEPPLWVAVKENQLDIVVLLLHRGATLDGHPGRGRGLELMEWARYKQITKPAHPDRKDELEKNKTSMERIRRLLYNTRLKESDAAGKEKRKIIAIKEGVKASKVADREAAKATKEAAKAARAVTRAAKAVAKAAQGDKTLRATTSQGWV